MRWHFLLSAAADGAQNMALDEAMMTRAARTGEALFRVYSWSSPTLSLGRNQRAKGAYDLDGARARGIDIVRRPTGGRALLHHREVTYCATMPTATPEEAITAYTFINEVLLAALERLGVPAQRAGAAGVALPPGLRPCFDVPSADEIVVGGRKLVGSAQWRRGGALLQHGSILVRDDQALVGALLKDAADADTPRAATLHEALGRDPSIEEVAGHIRQALARAVGEPDALPGDALAAEASVLRANYLDDSWTWRR